MPISRGTDEASKAICLVTQEVVKPGFDLELSEFKINAHSFFLVSKILSTWKVFQFMSYCTENVYYIFTYNLFSRNIQDFHRPESF